MDHKFTELIKKWLETPPSERDYTVGALYLLKLSGNRIMYQNIVSCIDRRHDIITYQLQKYYNFRVKDFTRVQVEEMTAQVAQIVEKHIPLAAKADTQTEGQGSPKGKRADHDSLPDDIKAKYVENLSLLQRMREVHLQLRKLSTEDAVCPDSERYPFLKELIDLDKKLHSNWEEYDHYVADAPAPVVSADGASNVIPNETEGSKVTSKKKSKKTKKS